jgi:hypothetical protein
MLTERPPTDTFAGPVAVVNPPDDSGRPFANVPTPAPDDTVGRNAPTVEVAPPPPPPGPVKFDPSAANPEFCPCADTESITARALAASMRFIIVSSLKSGGGAT